VSTLHITRLVTSIDVESFKAEVPRKLSALLQRSDALDGVIAFQTSRNTHADVDPWQQNTETLVEGGDNRDRRFNCAHIKTICRRPGETVGLLEPENDGQAST